MFLSLRANHCCMTELNTLDAVLLLEDGTLFKGKSAGVKGITTGELCFNTAMTGYQEAFTDPSYFGQLLIMTNVHIGNYGSRYEESENDKVTIKGLICRNFSHFHSRPSADTNLNDFLAESGVNAIYDIDTRALVRHIRSKGAMNGLICSDGTPLNELKAILEATPSMSGLELASEVCTKESYELQPTGENLRKIAVMDYGVKKNILRCFLERGCSLKVFPAKTPFEEVQNWNPDGYFLSNGPGDPGAMEYSDKTVDLMLKSGKPLFGICLGHQLLCKALGIKTYKMHHGHRGINHPVLNVKTGKGEITSQNHGFGVDREMLESATDAFEITHINLNDDTVEGVRLKNYPAFSVQYHPEAAPGPHDARYLFDEFIALIDNQK